MEQTAKRIFQIFYFIHRSPLSPARMPVVGLSHAKLPWSTYSLRVLPVQAHEQINVALIRLLDSLHISVPNDTGRLPQFCRPGDYRASILLYPDVRQEARPPAITIQEWMYIYRPMMQCRRLFDQVPLAFPPARQVMSQVLQGCFDLVRGNAEGKTAGCANLPSPHPHRSEHLFVQTEHPPARERGHTFRRFAGQVLRYRLKIVRELGCVELLSGPDLLEPEARIVIERSFALKITMQIHCYAQSLIAGPDKRSVSICRSACLIASSSTAWASRAALPWVMAAS